MGFIKEEDREPGIEGFDFYFEAFEELSTTRQIGMAVGPIPFTAIVDYFNIYQLSDFDEFSYVMRRMDKIYLENNNSELSKGKGAPINNAATKSDKKNKN